MTISSTQSAITWPGTGAQSVFTFPFVWGAADWISVTYTDPDGVDWPLTPSEYTFAGNPAGPSALWGVGGAVTYLRNASPIPIGSTLTIRRTLPVTQLYSFLAQQGFNPANIERALDQLCMILQQVERDFIRDAGGERITNVGAPVSPTDAATAGWVEAFVAGLVKGGGTIYPSQWEFTGNGTQTVFPIPTTESLGPTSTYFVTLDGVAQTPGTDFTVLTDQQTITFDAAPPNGSKIVVRCFGFARTIGVGPQGPRGLGLDGPLFLGAAPHNSDASSGWFADYDCKANVVLRMSQAENLRTVDGPGAFRELLFVEHVDKDVIDYTAIGQRVSMAMRAIVSGARDGGGNYALQYKDLVGADFAAIGRIGWPARGVSGIVASATQMGSGIASNEFSVENPPWALEQSISMAGVQGIVRVGKADAGPGHTYFGVLSTTVGMKSTAAFGANGQSLYSIYLADNTVHYAAIRMPQSGVGNVGTIIEYDANDYTLYDRAGNEYMWVIGGAIIQRMSSSAITSLVPIVLPAHPTHDMHAATKKYVDDAIATVRR